MNSGDLFCYEILPEHVWHEVTVAIEDSKYTSTGGNVLNSQAQDSFSVCENWNSRRIEQTEYEMKCCPFSSNSKKHIFFGEQKRYEGSNHLLIDVNSLTALTSLSPVTEEKGGNRKELGERIQNFLQEDGVLIETQSNPGKINTIQPPSLAETSFSAEDIDFWNEVSEILS
mmetsp:Transcript_30392/g.39225  ORF Transcript_30392/g.39225 Transcript_30392/m.39225 type:complete len:171 (-) Transcript_30392:65-577(-)